MRVPGVGGPAAVLRAALSALLAMGVTVERVSAIRPSRPLGPSRRTYANAAALIAAAFEPPAMLATLQQVERTFARRRRGACWQARTLDLDIVLWSGGGWATPTLVIPHPRWRERPFVLGPAAAIAPLWRDPVTGRTVRQMAARQERGRRAMQHRPS